LTQLSKTDLNEREMGVLLGGSCGCGCGCAYEGNGGSTSADNSSANRDSDLYSPGYTGGSGPTEEPQPTCTWINTNYICYNGPVNCNSAPNKC